MKTLRTRLVEFVMFALLVTFCAISAGQSMVKASNIPPACAGLSCYDGSDCGSKCFCNRPSSTCYDDTLALD
jgi:hypothetical protein